MATISSVDEVRNFSKAPLAMMTIRQVLLILLLAAGSLTTFAQERVSKVSYGGLFSYRTPPGWKVLRLPQIANPIASDPTQLPAPPYIQVDTIDSETSLADFIASNKKKMKVMVPSSVIVDEKTFVISPSLKATRLVVTSHPTKNDLKSVYFLFEGPRKTKFVVYCSSLAKDFPVNEPIFDAALKTFVPES